MRLSDEQIGAELRALRPAPSERFAAELDSWVSEGFPSSGRLASGTAPAAREGTARVRAAGARLRRSRAWALRPALAGGAALFLVAVIAVGVIQSGGTEDGAPQSRDLSGTTSPAPLGAAENAGTAKGEIGTAVPPTTPVPPSGDRPRNGQSQVQERSASLGLSTDPDQLQDVADGVVQVTDRYDGFVDSSSVQAGGQRGHASFALRIPTIHLRDAIADISGLAHVTARNEGTVNVTGAYVSAGERFSDARASVDALVAKLETATSASEIASLREQLSAARGELAAARSELRGLKQRVSLTPVEVTITASGDGDGWSIGDAADDALSVLEATGGAALVTLAVLVPLSALGLVAWLGVRELRRRRREAPLDR